MLERQIEKELKLQRTLQRQAAQTSKLKQKLEQTRKVRNDPEATIYADIFDLDDRIKQKEKDIVVLERALR